MKRQQICGIIWWWKLPDCLHTGISDSSHRWMKRPLTFIQSSLGQVRNSKYQTKHARGQFLFRLVILYFIHLGISRKGALGRFWEQSWSTTVEWDVFTTASYTWNKGGVRTVFKPFQHMQHIIKSKVSAIKYRKLIFTRLKMELAWILTCTSSVWYS